MAAASASRRREPPGGSPRGAAGGPGRASTRGHRSHAEERQIEPRGRRGAPPPPRFRAPPRPSPLPPKAEFRGGGPPLSPQGRPGARTGKGPPTQERKRPRAAEPGSQGRGGAPALPRVRTRKVAHLDQLCVNTIRTLSMDAVQQANSGHPGTPMAMAPGRLRAVAARTCASIPNDPIWPNRDRFVLSMGHASMLLYSLLHLAGVKAVNPKYETLGELVGAARRHQALPPARQPLPRPSRSTAGRPGVETTTGPLGQGVATSVGMAIAGQLAGRPLQPARLRDVRLRRLRAVRATAA